MDSMCLLQHSCFQLWSGQQPQSDSRRRHGIYSSLHRRVFACLLLIYIAAASKQQGAEWQNKQQVAGARARMVRRVEHILDEKFRAFYKKEPVTKKIKETAVKLEQELFKNATSRAMYEDGATLRLRIAALLRQKVEQDEHAKQQERKALSEKKYSLFDQPLDEDWLAASLYNSDSKGDSGTKHDLLILAGIMITVYAVAVGALNFHSLLRFARSIFTAAPYMVLTQWMGMASTSTNATKKTDKAVAGAPSKQAGHHNVPIVQSSSSSSMHSRTKGPTKRQGSSSGSRRSGAGGMLPAKQDSSVGRSTLSGTGASGHAALRPPQHSLQEQQQQQQQQEQQRKQHECGGSAPPASASSFSVLAAEQPQASSTAEASQHAPAGISTDFIRESALQASHASLQSPAALGHTPEAVPMAPPVDPPSLLPVASDACMPSAPGGSSCIPAAGVVPSVGTSYAAADEADECTLCLEAPRQSILAPCGHCALCSACTLKLYGPPAEVMPEASCPICCQRVRSYVSKVYLA